MRLEDLCWQDDGRDLERLGIAVKNRCKWFFHVYSLGGVAYMQCILNLSSAHLSY